MNKITAEEYTNNLFNAIMQNKENVLSLYGGIEGAKRFAREYGHGLGDYDDKTVKAMIGKSYSYLCVRFYNLKPPIDNKVWVGKIMEGVQAVRKKKVS